MRFLRLTCILAGLGSEISSHVTALLFQPQWDGGSKSSFSFGSPEVNRDSLTWALTDVEPQSGIRQWIVGM